MDGAGAQDGFGPPWDPADPVPDLEDTQALPGLGAVSGPGDASGRAGGGLGAASAHTRSADTTTSWPAGARQEPEPGASGDPAVQPGAGQSRGAFESAGRNADGTGQDTSPGTDTGTGKEDAGKPDGDGTAAKAKRRSFWRELPVLIVVALVLALVIKAFAFQAFYIPSGSMENTLKIGDRVLINKIVYHLRSIHRGDIVVFDGTGSWNLNNPQPSQNIFSKALDELEGLVGISHDSNIYIKRVIGLPGDHVVCCNAMGQITVNNVPLRETSYLYPGNAPSARRFSITVPAGRLWVMGDHRAVSYDSRGHLGDPGGGTIPESGVLGRAFVIIWPPSQWGILNIPATFEQPKLNASAAAAGGSKAALLAAMDNGTPIRPAGSPLPIALGFIGAVPVTWLQRRARRRLKSLRARRRR